MLRDFPIASIRPEPAEPDLPNQLHIVLYQPEIPQNTGTIGRTCVALDAKLWLVGPLGFRMDERRLRRAGLDYWQHLQWERVADWPSLLQRLPSAPVWFFSKKALRPYTTADFGPSDVLVFGSETQGLPASLLRAEDEHCLRIPMRSEARSLNLACSVAIAAYEWSRQNASK